VPADSGFLSLDFCNFICFIAFKGVENFLKRSRTMEEKLSSKAQGEATMGGFSKIINTYFEPRKVFESLRIKPTWVIPFIIVALLGVTSFWFTYPLIMKDVITNIQENEQYTEQQKELIIERIGGGEHPPIYQLAFAPVGVIVYLLLISAVLYFVFNVLLGGGSSFKRVLSVFSYSSLIAIPQAIVKIPLTFAKQTADIQTSLAIFLSPDSKDTFLYRVLSGFDIFTLWQVILIALGLAVMYKYTMKKTFNVVLILWILLIVVGAGVSGLFGGMLGLG
jgi:hypothetical protein